MTGVKLGVLTDLHRSLAADERGAWHNDYDFVGLEARLERAADWFEQEAVDRVVVCGDLTHRGDPHAMRAVVDLCRRRFGRPLMAVAGNHDVAAGEDVLDRELRRVDDPRLVLADPVGDVLGGVRLAGVQLAPGSGWFGSQLREPPALDAWGDEPVVLVSHFPLLSRASAIAARGMPYPGDLVDREPVATALAARPAPTLVVAGHIHVRDAHALGPVLQLTQAALIEPPFDAAVLEVRAQDDGGIVVARQTVRMGEQRVEHEPTLVDPVGSWRYAAGAWTDVERAGRGSDRAPLPLALEG